MSMKLIEVRTVKGRVAFDAPGGKQIPDDKFVSVRETPYIRRLLQHHGDIELRRDAPSKQLPAPAASTSSK